MPRTRSAMHYTVIACNIENKDTVLCSDKSAFSSAHEHQRSLIAKWSCKRWWKFLTRFNCQSLYWIKLTGITRNTRENRYCRNWPILTFPDGFVFALFLYQWSRSWAAQHWTNNKQLPNYQQKRNQLLCCLMNCQCTEFQGETALHGEQNMNMMASFA